MIPASSGATKLHKAKQSSEHQVDTLASFIGGTGEDHIDVDPPSRAQTITNQQDEARPTIASYSSHTTIEQRREEPDKRSPQAEHSIQSTDSSPSQRHHVRWFTSMSS